MNFSGELSLLNLNLMGAQLGSEVQVADSSKKVKGADFAILTVTDDKGTKIRYAEARAHFCPRCRVHHERGQEHQRHDRGRR